MRAPRVVIVGAGPAGASMAAALGEHGIRALVLERDVTPREKPGECLPPSAGPVLQRLGIELEEGVHARCPAFVSGWETSLPEARDFLFDPRGEGWILDRRAFERQLVARAEARGAAFRRGERLEHLSRLGSGWRVTIGRGDRTRAIDADFIVDASGRPAVVARRLGAERVREEPLVASWALVPDARERSAVVRVEAVEDGWWYAVTTPDRRRSIAFFGAAPVRDRAVFARRAPPRLELHEAPAALRFASAESARTEPASGPGWFAIGDAALAFDPLASQGLSFALGTAWYATQALVTASRGDADAYAAYAALLADRWERYREARSETYARSRFRTRPFWSERSRGVG